MTENDVTPLPTYVDLPREDVTPLPTYTDSISYQKETVSQSEIQSTPLVTTGGVDYMLIAVLGFVALGLFVASWF